VTQHGTTTLSAVARGVWLGAAAMGVTLAVLYCYWAFVDESLVFCICLFFSFYVC
jgi:hypothetical protein